MQGRSSWTPAELGLARDPQVLGVAIRRIALHQGMGSIPSKQRTYR